MYNEFNFQFSNLFRNFADKVKTYLLWVSNYVCQAASYGLIRIEIRLVVLWLKISEHIMYCDAVDNRRNEFLYCYYVVVAWVSRGAIVQILNFKCWNYSESIRWLNSNKTFNLIKNNFKQIEITFVQNSRPILNLEWIHENVTMLWNDRLMLCFPIKRKMYLLLLSWDWFRAFLVTD